MASSDLNIGPTSPVTPPPASRALTRITPVAPEAVTDGSPLKRSGLNVLEIFNASDELVVRTRTPAVALELGLEQARGSMVRNQPADALATLDEVWSGARHTETGWYLRGGSLALLGLPGEAARIASEALQINPQSSANHFLQSLARLTLGDTAGAQQALANAAANSEPEPLLLIQHALIEAQRGNVSSAEELLRRAATNWPDHPALIYGRDMMREVLRSNVRERQRTPVQSPRIVVDESPLHRPSMRTPPNATTSTATPFGATSPSATSSSATSSGSRPNTATPSAAASSPATPPNAAPSTTAPFTTTASAATPPASRTPISSSVVIESAPHSETEDRAHAPDIASSALHDLGAQLTNGTKRQALTESRALLASLSAGGTLASSIPAARAHALRAIVGATIDALNGRVPTNGQGWDAESIDGQWQRSQPEHSGFGHRAESVGANTNESLHTVVRALVTALGEGRVAEADMQLRRSRGALGETSYTLLRAILGADERAPHVRDGDGAHARAAQVAYETGNARVQDGFSGHMLLAPLRLGLALLPEEELPGRAVRMPSDSNAAVSYAGAMSSVSFGDELGNVIRPAGSTGSFIAAAGLIALAVLAYSTSHPILATALIGAGGWLALRKGSQGARL